MLVLKGTRQEVGCRNHWHWGDSNQSSWMQLVMSTVVANSIIACVHYQMSRRNFLIPVTWLQVSHCWNTANTRIDWNNNFKGVKSKKMWSSRYAVLRKAQTIKPVQRRLLPLSSFNWNPQTRSSSTNSGGVGKWIRRRIYGTMIIVGVSAGGVLMVY